MLAGRGCADSVPAPGGVVAVVIAGLGKVPENEAVGARGAGRGCGGGEGRVIDEGERGGGRVNEEDGLGSGHLCGLKGRADCLCRIAPKAGGCCGVGVNFSGGSTGADVCATCGGSCAAGGWSGGDHLLPV